MEVSDNRRVDPSDPLIDGCPGRELFETVTARWTLLILWALKDGTLRFSAVRDRVEGISERVLSQNLKALCRSGIIEREVEASVPPKVRYTLTESGHDLLSVMDGLTGWIARNLSVVDRSKRAYDDAQPKMT